MGPFSYCLNILLEYFNIDIGNINIYIYIDQYIDLYPWLSDWWIKWNSKIYLLLPFFDFFEPFRLTSILSSESVESRVSIITSDFEISFFTVLVILNFDLFSEIISLVTLLYRDFTCLLPRSGTCTPPTVKSRFLSGVVFEPLFRTVRPTLKFGNCIWLLAWSLIVTGCFGDRFGFINADIFFPLARRARRSFGFLWALSASSFRLISVNASSSLFDRDSQLSRRVRRRSRSLRLDLELECLLLLVFFEPKTWSILYGSIFASGPGILWRDNGTHDSWSMNHGHIWLQCWSRKGPNIVAMMMTIGT